MEQLSPFPSAAGVGEKWIRPLVSWFSKLHTYINAKLNVSDQGGSAAWDDISFNFLSAQSVGSGVPTLTSINSTSRYGYAYTDESVVGNEKRQTWGVQVPHGVKLGSELRFHVHFYTGARVPAVDEYVRMELDVCITGIGDVLATTAYTADCIIPAGTPAYTHWKGKIKTLTSTTVGPSTDIGGTLRRKSSVASDTYADTIYVVYGDPHAQFNRRGTYGEIS